MAQVHDVIVIGGGHNGLILGCYLAKAGLRPLVLERLSTPGGGVSSREVVPGYTFSFHANNLNWVHIGPVLGDLELDRFGVRFLFPQTICSQVFSDGRSLTLHRDLDRTAAEIGRFSRNDADRYRDWIRRQEPAFEACVRDLFAPPAPPSVGWAALEESHEGREVLRTSLMSTANVAEELFENDCVRTWMVNYCLQAINDPFAKGTGLIPLLLHVNQHRSGGNSLVAGGTQGFADALVACLEFHGGAVRPGSHVSRLRTVGGRARGVTLSDGTEIEAARAVVSNVEPKQVFLRMMDESETDPEFLGQIRRFRFSHYTSFGVHLALNADPVYRSSSEAPDQAYNVMIGKETMEDIRTLYYHLDIGVPPERKGFMVVHPTRFDPSVAPPGKHYAILWQYAPIELRDRNTRWRDIKEAFADDCVALLRRFTKNMDPDAIVGRAAYSPEDAGEEIISMVGGDQECGATTQDQMGIFRPFHGCPPYRTPIQGLYLCGPSTHPGGGVHGANGYNAAGAIADDLGIEKWWAGRGFKVLR